MYNSDGTDKDGRIGLGNLPRVTRDEALELMIHHLQMASVYYEAVPGDEDSNRAELERIMGREIVGAYVPPELPAARAWLTSMDTSYAQLKKDLET